MRALRARYLRLWRNRYAAFQAVDICRKRQSIFAPYGASESGFEIIIYIYPQFLIFNFQLSSCCRRARTFPISLLKSESASDCHTVSTAEKGCRDGQLVGECRRARTKTYVTEAEPTRSPYMRPYTASGGGMGTR